MSISKLKAELQKMQRFDEENCVCSMPRGVRMREDVAYVKGAQWQHAKSARMAEMLLEAVEALEKIRKYRGLLKHVELTDIADETLTKLAKGAD